MAREVSIVFSAKDNYSDTLLKIKQSQTGLRTSTKELQRELDTMLGAKRQMTIDLSRAKRELDDAKRMVRDAQKSMEGLDEAERRLGEEQENYDSIRSNLDAVSRAARTAQKDGLRQPRLDKQLDWQGRQDRPNRQGEIPNDGPRWLRQYRMPLASRRCVRELAVHASGGLLLRKEKCLPA